VKDPPENERQPLNTKKNPTNKKFERGKFTAYALRNSESRRRSKRNSFCN
jgi:hypothetical protein